MRVAVVAILVIAASAVVFTLGAVVVGPMLWPAIPEVERPELAAVPPLPPLTRPSVVVVPAVVPIPAIREALEAATPSTLTGKRDNPLPQALSNADLGWTVERGALTVVGQTQALTASAPFAGALRLTGQVSAKVGNLGGQIGNLIGGDAGKQLQDLGGKPFDQRVNLHGEVTVTSHPMLLPEWRLEPNLTAQVNLDNASLPVAGLRLNVPNEIRPMLERAVSQQAAALQARLRSDPFIEVVARREWARLCRAIPLGANGAGLADLWLEVRPTRAFAAQPAIDATSVKLLLSVQAQTRVTPTETKPDCPFPQRLEIVPQLQPQGQMHIAVPVDIPFAEVNRLLEAQLTRQRIQDGDGAAEITIQSARVAPSGDRLLISLRLNAREKSFFSFGTDATVHVWGRPVLDREHQILRLVDIVVDVQSEEAFGLIGVAAKTALPLLTAALAERAAIDLKPIAENAKTRIAAAVNDVNKPDSRIRIGASVTDLRLVAVNFDASTLRLIMEADGALDIAVTTLDLR